MGSIYWFRENYYGHGMINYTISINGIWHRWLPSHWSLEWPRRDGDGWHLHAFCGEIQRTEHDFPFNKRNIGILIEHHIIPTCESCRNPPWNYYPQPR